MDRKLAGVAERVAIVRDLYEHGFTQEEIGRLFDRGESSVRRFMGKHGIAARRTGAPLGSRNHNWKERPNYAAMHFRVITRRGAPKECEVCGTTDRRKRYDWANLTGDYLDPDDFERMCRSCHAKFDGAVRNLGRYAQ